ncbi:uncharacterized protein LOC133843972 [Drosophila sulfurigaster albostrigata]|uniref:uncharacterized protein LOC133843972 n=1 Tax=Drosophila sulfurigaster albostrigata TaxID=89887 RepID=UPI002D21D853|nr:uncharacterized protein LOC133843972 [Drosophila sulfurigaster albostrigata]
MAATQLISHDESLHILRRQNGKELPIVEIQLQQLKQNAGFLGEYYVLRIVSATGSPATTKVHQFFVKTLPQKNLEFRKELELYGVLKKESAIYKKILPKLREYAKRQFSCDCFLARDDLLVLEDLTLSSKQLQQQEVITIQHYRVILQQLATLHAASIAWERAEQTCLVEQFPNELEEFLLSSENKWYLTGLKAIVYLALQHKSFQDITSQQFIKNNVYQLLLQAADQLTKPSKKLRNVFSHRDLSRSNIFLNSHQGCLFIDFGLCSYSTPAIDIHFMLYINSSIEERRLMYNEIMEYYFDELQARFKLMDIPSEEVTREDFELDCKRGHLVGLIVSALCLPVFKIPADLCTKLKFENSSKFDYWMNVDRSELLELAMAQDAAYKTEVMSIIAELVEYLMQNAKLIKDLIV